MTCKKRILNQKVFYSKVQTLEYLNFLKIFSCRPMFSNKGGNFKIEILGISGRQSMRYYISLELWEFEFSDSRINFLHRTPLVQVISSFCLRFLSCDWIQVRKFRVDFWKGNDLNMLPTWTFLRVNSSSHLQILLSLLILLLPFYGVDFFGLHSSFLPLFTLEVWLFWMCKTPFESGDAPLTRDCVGCLS